VSLSALSLLADLLTAHSDEYQHALEQRLSLDDQWLVGGIVVPVESYPTVGAVSVIDHRDLQGASIDSSCRRDQLP
jgi:hypothetical protein